VPHRGIPRLLRQKPRFSNLTKLYSFGKVLVSPFFHLKLACERKRKKSCGQAASMQGSPNEGIGDIPRDCELAAPNLLVVRAGRFQCRARTAGRIAERSERQRRSTTVAALRLDTAISQPPRTRPLVSKCVVLMPPAAPARPVCGCIGLWVARVRDPDHIRPMTSRRPAYLLRKRDDDSARPGGR
jgi:hypothetical protein